MSNTGYFVSASGSVKTNTGANVACNANAPCLSYNGSFGTVNNSNSNFACTPAANPDRFRFFF